MSDPVSRSAELQALCLDAGKLQFDEEALKARRFQINARIEQIRLQDIQEQEIRARLNAVPAVEPEVRAALAEAQTESA